MKKIRTYDILAYLKKKKRCTLRELMEKFKVSSATIHRDVSELVSSRAVERVRGGIVFADVPLARPGARGYHDRAVANLQAKERIAAKAAGLVSEGDILFLDSSTTVLAFAEKLLELDFDHLTILTNSVSVMEKFNRFPPHWVLIGLGGNYDHQLNSILGAAAIRQLSDFNITKAFVSAFGLNDRTATTNHERQSELIKRVLDIAEHRYLLIDGTKLGRSGLYRLSARGAFDAIISDKD
jgi:DeoR/GlpR family transcriptional regulator of sugar metabolism